MLTASVLGLAGLSAVLPQSTAYEYAGGVLSPVELVTKPAPTPLPVEDPNADHQAAVKARNYLEVQTRWYVVAAAIEANIRKAAAEAAARAAAREAAKAKPRPVVHVQTTASTKPGVEQWRSMVAVYTDWDVNLMLKIMGCESGGNPNSKNRHSTASGLFQILGGPFDPAANIALAHSMWSTRGSQPWAASSSCW